MTTQFCFELTPVEEIEAWRGPDGASLSWYGLTWGSYFIDVEGHRLLEYAAGREPVTYQVARLHQDVLQMLPDVLNAVPEALVAQFHGESLLATYDALFAIANERALEDPLWDALEGFRVRCLDTLYLSPGANVAFWRNGEEVVVEWDNRVLRIAGEPAWSALQGRVSISVDEFQSSVADFHRRFISAMRTRINDVTSRWSRPEVRLDAASLEESQAFEEQLFENSLGVRPRTIPWEVAIATLLGR